MYAMEKDIREINEIFTKNKSGIELKIVKKAIDLSMIAWNEGIITQHFLYYTEYLKNKIELIKEQESKKEEQHLIKTAKKFLKRPDSFMWFGETSLETHGFIFGYGESSGWYCRNKSMYLSIIDLFKKAGFIENEDFHDTGFKGCYGEGCQLLIRIIKKEYNGLDYPKAMIDKIGIECITDIFKYFYENIWNPYDECISEYVVNETIEQEVYYSASEEIWFSCYKTDIENDLMETIEENSDLRFPPINELIEEISGETFNKLYDLLLEKEDDYTYEEISGFAQELLLEKMENYHSIDSSIAINEEKQEFLFNVN